MKQFIVAIILLFPFCLFAKDTQTQPKAKGQTQTRPAEVVVSYDVLLEGTYSGVRDPLAKVITDSKDFEELWKKHVSMIVPQPLIPKVDFDGSVVVAIFAGEKRTSGYQIVLKSVAAKDKNVEVTYRETEPPANSMMLQVLTQPFLMLRITKPASGSVILVKK